ncbi:hypothetical protein BgAZ_207540 [Babesia gibsoni]|uniref:Rab-GAP TBC domain-containing protein n=1 Tax=Babesia gibsoni TaxID=33632 RepID=A0AAD8UU73_BABGI|nr:hypothetical protein BgAZ_207540 [Babesia gibsoni]
MAEMKELSLQGDGAVPKATSPQSAGAASSKQEQSSSSILEIFGFGTRNILNKSVAYGMIPSMPQCSCKRVPIKPKGTPIETIKNSKNQNIPRYIKGERCARFNSWWLKCCQSVVLRRAGVYWSVIQLLEEKIVLDGVKTTVGDLVVNEKTTLAIRLDIRRTYPSLRFYNRYGRLIIRRILMAYAFFDPEVGYVQGLNFVVANLLWHCTEEQAFWAFISMMYIYECRCMYLPRLPGVFRRSEVLEKCLEKYIPKLAAHLKSVGVHMPMIASDWLMTLCANSIPIKPLGLLWDAFFDEGWIAIYRFIIYRLMKFEPYLLTMNDVADIMKVIKYGSISHAESWSLVELIPGFATSTENKGVKLVTGAYSSNCENLSNDPNKNCNTEEWIQMVWGSIKYDVSAELIDKLELQNNDDVYFECNDANKLFPSEEADCKSDGLLSRSSSLEKIHIEPVEYHGEQSVERTKIPESVTLGKSGYEILRQNGMSEIADKLEELSRSFRQQLIDMGHSNAYSLHLKALRDE